VARATDPEHERGTHAMSSTDNTPPVEPTTPVAGSTAAPIDSTTSQGQISTDPTAGDETFPASTTTPEAEKAPGWVARHTTLLTTVMIAVIVAALAVAGLTYYRHTLDERNDDTEAAFVAMVTEQGATVETVECDGDTCAAVISGQAYTVLVQDDEDGEQHFGVSAYAGD
jgi:hypothetical protein